ncbi:hypothetical protein CXG81DRAFT_20928 [Caulochytrium protostelioides]|uniref:Uncharacterized protein n=1 Tax=Caulochytrium protostelioides TaxID=1555241 RepID=A0A4P9X1C2_9FUNG|nr:hypothetical protein CXG81DRAFT_20928 [Caulochytrium protostelioides]|eukprot:RKO98922.1 hypothetical protein CXG81DRAFT_20928 [Caulochytrium protostelioides]
MPSGSNGGLRRTPAAGTRAHSGDRPHAALHGSLLGQGRQRRPGTGPLRETGSAPPTARRDAQRRLPKAPPAECRSAAPMERSVAAAAAAVAAVAAAAAVVATAALPWGPSARRPYSRA